MAEKPNLIDFLTKITIIKLILEDTADVKAAKEDFFKVFIDATNGLIKTVENFYIEGNCQKSVK